MNHFGTQERRTVSLFEEIALPHLDAAHNLARWLTRDPDDAQEVVQEAYLRAFRYFHTYRGADPKAWLLAIVRNTAATFRGRRQHDAAVESFDEAAHSSAFAQPAREEISFGAAGPEFLRTCLDSLPLEFREVLILRELEEMSYRRISDIVGIPIGTVMSRLSRGRKRLERCVRAAVKGIAK